MSRTRRVERALEVLNAEPTEQMLTRRLEELSGDKGLAQLGPALFARRAEIGSFRDAGDLEGVECLSDADIAALIEGLSLPTYEFETEKLEFVYWAHGSGLVIERPEVFGPIQRRKQGIRVASYRRQLDSSDPSIPGVSWAHMSVPAPSFAEGKQFYVKSVLFNFESSSSPFGVKGQPIATPYDVEVWDGHVRIASERINYLSTSSNRYLRVPVDSGQKLRWGLSVSFLLFVYPVVEGADYSFWIDIGAVGVELVTRTGLVVTRLP